MLVSTIFFTLREMSLKKIVILVICHNRIASLRIFLTMCPGSFFFFSISDLLCIKISERIPIGDFVTYFLLTSYPPLQSGSSFGRCLVPSRSASAERGCSSRLRDGTGTVFGSLRPEFTPLEAGDCLAHNVTFFVLKQRK